MEEKLLERLVVAFERIAEEQGMQTLYLMELKAQHAVRYAKHDEWRIVDEKRDRDAGSRKEREVHLAEFRAELEIEVMKVRLDHVAPGAEQWALEYRELLQRYGIGG